MTIGSSQVNDRAAHRPAHAVEGPDLGGYQLGQLVDVPRLGVRKLRLTGGEPLLRRDLERLIAMLAAIGGIQDVALTTNGALLAGKARALADAGLRRVTVSLDSLDVRVCLRGQVDDEPAGGRTEQAKELLAQGGSGRDVEFSAERGHDVTVLPGPAGKTEARIIGRGVGHRASDQGRGDGRVARIEP
jgi:hypothetical protein